jgi:hypothetical protein
MLFLSASESREHVDVFVSLSVAYLVSASDAPANPNLSDTWHLPLTRIPSFPFGLAVTPHFDSKSDKRRKFGPTCEGPRA